MIFIKNKEFTLEEQQESVESVYGRVANQMPNLVTELREYTNGIANKKTFF